MFRSLRAAAGAVVILTLGVHAVRGDGINPAASTAAAALPDSGVSPELIDLMADAVIAKLKAKPEILLDIILSYEEKNRTGLAMIRPEDPVSGAADGDVTVVEFFDPSCIPCRTAGVAIENAAAADPKLRVVHKDYPTTQEGIGLSVDALGGKSYADARKAILAGRAPTSADAAGRTKALEILARNREAAKRAQVDVLPTLFVVGPTRAERIEGPVTAEAIAARVAAARALRK